MEMNAPNPAATTFKVEKNTLTFHFNIEKTHNKTQFLNKL